MIIKNDHLEISPSLIIHGFSIIFMDSHFLHKINIRYKTTLGRVFRGAVEWSHNERRL